MSRTQIDGQEGIYSNAQTANYTVTAADQARLVTMKSTVGLQLNLPQATGSFASPFWFYVQNAGSNIVNIVPTTSTIDGSANLYLTPGQSLLIVSSSGNYICLRGYVPLNNGITAALIFG